MSHICICVNSFSSWLSAQSAVLGGKNFKIGYYVQALQKISFVPTVFIVTIDLFHFIPLSVILTSDKGHNVSEKQNQLDSFFCSLLYWPVWNNVEAI